MTRVARLLFGFDGRIGRIQYWVAYVVWGAIGLAAYFTIKVILAAANLDASAVAFVALAALVYLPFMVSAVALGLKRLHDRDKSGWWLAFYYLGPVALSLLVFAIAGTNPDSSETARHLQFIILGIHIWMLIDLGCLRGSPGPNRFGPEAQPAM